MSNIYDFGDYLDDFDHQPSPTMKTRLHDAFKYYQGLPHQDKAIDYLAHTMYNYHMDEFFRLFSPPQPPTEKHEPFLLLQAFKKFDTNGLRILCLDFYKDGKLEGRIPAFSGITTTQASWCFQQAKDSPPELCMPIPEGLYHLPGAQGAPDVTLEWAQGRVDDYTTSWGPGLGPLWVQLEFQGETARDFLGMHLDAGGPGSAGCVVFRDIDALKDFVAAMRKVDPRKLYVDWGLGSCPPTPIETGTASEF